MLYLSPNFFELFAKTEVLGAGQVLRARGQPLDLCAVLDSGRVALACVKTIRRKNAPPVLFGGRPRVVGCSVCTGTNARADGHRQYSRVWIKRVSLQDFQDSLSALPASAQALVRDMAQGYCQQAQYDLPSAV